MGSGQEKIGILYWGIRGGGKVLTEQLIDQAQMQGISTATFLRPLKRGSADLISIFSFWTWLMERRRVIRISIFSEITTMIIPMASPWDIFVGHRLKKSGIKVTRIIHDARPHPGDRFPPKIWIKALCFDCTQIVTLSEYVANQLINLEYAKQDKINIGKLPEISVSIAKQNLDSFPRNNFLFIGRGRAYKGLDLLLSSWPNVGNPDSTLTIAGEGHLVINKVSRVRHINRWLSDREVFELIENSDVVVLPYIEASQSGIIPTAISLNRPVVITPVGGLSEQVRHGENGIISESVDPVSFAEAMNAASVGWFTFENEESQAERSSSLLKMCLGHK